MFFATGTPQHVIDAGLRQWNAMNDELARGSSQPPIIRSTDFPRQNSSAPTRTGFSPPPGFTMLPGGDGFQRTSQAGPPLIAMFGRAQPSPPPSQGTPYAPGYGGRIGMDPDAPRTHDWIDADRDGVDDRHQPGPGQRPGGPVNPKLRFGGVSTGGGGQGGQTKMAPGQMNQQRNPPPPSNPFGGGGNPFGGSGSPFGGGGFGGNPFGGGGTQFGGGGGFGGGSPFGGGGGGGGFGGNPFGGGGFGGGSPFGGGGFGGNPFGGGGNPFGGGGNPFGGFTPTGSVTTSFGNMPPVNAMPGGSGMSWGFPGSGGGMYQEPRMTFGSPQPNLGPGGFFASYGNPFGGAPTPTPNFAQRDALIQRLNEQMMPYQMGQKTGRPNININQSIADANRMVQGGWSNPFAFR